MNSETSCSGKNVNNFTVLPPFCDSSPSPNPTTLPQTQTFVKTKWNLLCLSILHYVFHQHWFLSPSVLLLWKREKHRPGRSLSVYQTVEFSMSDCLHRICAMFLHQINKAIMVHRVHHFMLLLTCIEIIGNGPLVGHFRISPTISVYIRFDKHGLFYVNCCKMSGCSA